MYFTNIFNLSKKCQHEHINLLIERSYCPDCGKLIENNWYLTRCANCGHKLNAVLKNGKISPLERYCSKCGSSEFIIENIDKVNFIDINFAVLQKNEVDDFKTSSTTLVSAISNII